MRPIYKTVGFSVVVCRHPDGKWYFSLVVTTYNFRLAVKETKNRGWWLPAGGLDAGETFPEAALRETYEEAGIQVELKGILRVEHSLCSETSARMRVIFYAEPKNPAAPVKSKPDEESECAQWVTIEQILELAQCKPGLRGPELLDWAKYIEAGGIISPIHAFADEGDPVPIPGKIVIESINAPINAKKWTQIHLAIHNNDLKQVKSLLEKNADLSMKTHRDRNAIHFACQSNTEICSIILEYLNKIPDEKIRREIINLQDCDKNTPLHFAAKVNKIENYKLLVKFGADETIRNNQGKIASELLSESK